MLFENILNVATLLATIVGLLACLFRYIKSPKRGYLYLTGFFLASFLSDYYWTIYMLVMGSYPDVSELLAYLGWNVAYVFLLLAVFTMRAKGARRYFHPVMLWPVLTNIVQFFLYIQFGGIFNNIWQVGTTTAIMVLCMQDLMYYLKNRKDGAKVPHLSLLILLYFIAEYGAWTASCFDWSSELQNPYLYFTLLVAAFSIFFARSAGKVYGSDESEDTEEGWMEYRSQVILEAVFTAVICGACAVGYLYATGIRDSLPDAAAGSESMIRMLFTTSLILIAIVIVILLGINLRYRLAKKRQKPDVKKQSRFNFIFTMAITLALMVLVIFYNSRTLYQSSVAGIYEDGRDVVASTATDLENYLTVAETTLRVAADSVALMEQNGASQQEILQYIVDQTTIQSEQFDENFTGIYAYIHGMYMDGAGWVPPTDYDPLTRDWYNAAVDAGGEIVLVSPYLDAQTGSVVLTVAKSIQTRGGEPGVVALDVIVNHIQDVTEQIEIAGKGYGIVVGGDGFIVAHRDAALNGQNVSDVYGEEFADRLVRTQADRFSAVLQGEQCVVFTHPIMEHWIAVIVVNNAELFRDVYSQIAVNIFVSLVIFVIISFFYYFGYKIEQNNSKKVKALNVQVVSALAEAIDAKDAYTNGHSSRVAKYAKMIAARAGYSEAEQDKIYMMGLLHDVGKIGVPDEVINKPGKLTEEEFEKIKLHPVVGSKILESIKERPELATGARWHHERYGGGGYPDGITGEKIPAAARIIAVADAYDAMTSRRSYRDPMPQEKVREEIANGSGSQFDPRFAEIMLRTIDEDPDFALRET
ncbi:MAG: HD domain-containing protein [Oscillospiraceae bacterium]|nr:HD domain-containing protein [Oscillospiraceae bacterium]